MTSDTAFKDDWEDIDSESAELASGFGIKPIAQTTEEADKVEQRVKSADNVSKRQGFSEPKRKKRKTFRRSDNLRTGRNELISIKGRIEDKQRISAMAEDREWVNGQTLQYALDALAEKIENPEDKFWQTRNFHGVD